MPLRLPFGRKSRLRTPARLATLTANFVSRSIWCQCWRSIDLASVALSIAPCKRRLKQLCSRSPSCYDTAIPLVNNIGQWNPFVKMINKPLHGLKDAASCLTFRVVNCSSPCSQVPIQPQSCKNTAPFATIRVPNEKCTSLLAAGMLMFVSSRKMTLFGPYLFIHATRTSEWHLRREYWPSLPYFRYSVQLLPHGRFGESLCTYIGMIWTT